MFEHVPVASITVDATGRIDSINRAATAMFDHRPEDLIGQDVSVLLPGLGMDELDRAASEQGGGNAPQTVVAGHHRIARRRNGDTFPVELGVGEIRQDGSRWFVCSITDLSNWERTVTRLRDANRRVALAVEAADIGIWDWDIGNDVLDWDARMLEIAGLDADRFYGTFQDWERSVHPDDLDRVAAAVSDAVARQYRLETSFRVVRPDATIRHVRIRANILRTEDGRPQHMIGICVDTTERTNLETQLRRSQRLQALGQLTGGIAHDFNNLLAILLGNAEFLGDLYAEDAEARAHVEAIKRAVDRGSSLTHRLLAFSRQQALSPVASDIAELIHHLEELLRRTLGEAINLGTVLAEDLWHVTVDPHEFENALINLALNARDAMPEGGSLVIDARNVTLDEIYCEHRVDVKPGDYVRVCVSDQGAGMSPEVLERAYEPFFTTKPTGKGSGLGLSMVYGFAKQSQGDMTIYSEIGRGTSVNLYLPRSPDTTAADRAADPDTPPATGHERIIVVEDDDGLRRISVRLLENQGYEVHEAKTGAQAIDLLERSPPFDLLFTDIVLPGGLSGIAVASQARRLHPAIGVLYTTGYAEHVTAGEDAVEPGVNLIHKPFTRSDLLRRVRETLDAGLPARG